MTDIVERLRFQDDQLCEDAAEEIERLRDLLGKVHEALGGGPDDETIQLAQIHMDELRAAGPWTDEYA